LGRPRTKFVLQPKGTSVHALASRIALVCYAKTVLDYDPQLFMELMNWAADEHDKAKKELEK
jgi:hypothetical protein